MTDDQLLGWMVFVCFQSLIATVMLNAIITWGWVCGMVAFGSGQIVFLPLFTGAMVGYSVNNRGPLACWKYFFTGE